MRRTTKNTKPRLSREQLLDLVKAVIYDMEVTEELAEIHWQRTTWAMDFVREEFGQDAADRLRAQIVKRELDAIEADRARSGAVVRNVIDETNDAAEECS